MKSLLIIVGIVATVRAGSVQIINGDNIITNGKCIYVDGEVYENGVKRPATQEETNEVQQWQAGMSRWGTDFAQYMQDKMSNMFNPNYAAPAQPQTPQPPCLCSPQYCDQKSQN